MSEEFTVQLEGGSPWGFALQGGTDHRSPLRIGKVTTGGRAAKGDLEAGDYILTINGEPTKNLKHLQAQQIVKRSTTTLTLHCTKVRPGVPFPAVLLPSSTLSAPTNGMRGRLGSLQHPKPPLLMQYNNGYRRSGSLSMPSGASCTAATSAATSTSSPSSCSPMDAEDSNFLGMEYSSSGPAQPQSQSCKAAHSASPNSVQNCNLDECVREDSVVDLEQKDSTLHETEQSQDKQAEPEQNQNEMSSYVADQNQNNIAQDQNGNEMSCDVPDRNPIEDSSDLQDQNQNELTEVVMVGEVEEDRAEKGNVGQEGDLVEENKMVAVKRVEEDEAEKGNGGQDEDLVEENKMVAVKGVEEDEAEKGNGGQEGDLVEEKMVADTRVEEDEKRNGGQEGDLVEENKMVAVKGVEEDEAEKGNGGQEGDLVEEKMVADTRVEEDEKGNGGQGDLVEEKMVADTRVKEDEKRNGGQGDLVEEKMVADTRVEEDEKRNGGQEGDLVEVKMVAGEGVDGREASSGTGDVGVRGDSGDGVASKRMGGGGESVDGEVSSGQVVKDVEGVSGDVVRAKVPWVQGGVIEAVENTGGRKVRSRNSSSGGSFSKWELAESINQAAQARSSREGSTDLSGSCKSEDISLDHHHYQQVQQQKVQAKQQPSPKKPPLAGSGSRSLPPSSQAVIKPSLSKKKSPMPMVTKEPGWYQQIFHGFTHQVDDDSGDAVSDSIENDPSYAYDYRGLKVRRDGRSLSETADGDQEAAQAPDVLNASNASDGLSVPGGRRYHGSLTGVGDHVCMGSGDHVRMGSTPAVMEGAKHRPGAKFHVGPGGTTTGDVLSSSKKSTTFKAQQYSTNNSRKYWDKKDKDHITFDEKRRKSQQEEPHRRTSSSDIVSTSMSAPMHPFLLEDGKDQSSEPTPRGNVLNKIDPTKLHGALSNATMLGKLEQEGVPSQLLPAISQQTRVDAQRQKEHDASKKKPKPPPGPNALATFNFEGRAEKELSFEKGDLLELIHLVDENWLEGALNGKTGIFPKNYVKVLSAAEYAAMTTVKPETPKQKAKALYEFRGQSDRELDLDQGDEVIIERKVDSNWFSGSIGERKGIFPVAYVQIED